MRISMKVSTLAGCVFLLIACTPSTPVPEEPAKQRAAPMLTAGDENAAASDVELAPLKFEPAALSACGSGKDVVTVSWDVTSISDVSSVRVLTVDKDGAERLFAATGPRGSKDTGQWAHAGSTMMVRDSDGNELVRASIGSIPCN